MKICISIECEIPEFAGSDQYAREALALRLYREGHISAGKVAEILEIARFEADEFLRANASLEIGL